MTGHERPIVPGDTRQSKFIAKFVAIEPASARDEHVGRDICRRLAFKAVDDVVSQDLGHIGRVDFVVQE